MEKYLIDTNIFLEVLLSQDLKEKCKSFLSLNINRISISDFSLHSIGVILFKLKRHEQYNAFLKDILPKINILTLPSMDYQTVQDIAINYNLDFDDAYQASIAKAYKLAIITIDSDFKKLEKDFKIEFISKG